MPDPGSDAGSDAAFDGGNDGGNDSGPEECGMPCAVDDICRVGRYDCSSGEPVCVPSENETDGVTCADDTYGEYDECEDDINNAQCAEIGRHSRDQFRWTCSAGECVSTAGRDREECRIPSDGTDCTYLSRCEGSCMDGICRAGPDC